MLLKIQEAMVKFKERYTTLLKALKEFRFYVEHRWLTYNQACSNDSNRYRIIKAC